MLDYDDSDVYLYWAHEDGEWKKIVTTYGEYKKLDKTGIKEIEITDRNTW